MILSTDSFECVSAGNFLNMDYSEGLRSHNHTDHTFFNPSFTSKHLNSSKFFGIPFPLNHLPTDLPSKLNLKLFAQLIQLLRILLSISRQ